MSLLNLMLGFGFFGQLFSFIGNLLSVVGDIIKFFLFLIIWQPFMIILIVLMALITFAELTFKALAGINPVYLNGMKYSGASGNGQDLVYAFITDGSVQNVFFSILALSFVLLFILTIVALIKAEFTLDLKGSAKGPIIARSLKSLANFLVVPVVSLISILGVNFLTRSVYEVFGTGVGGSMAGKCLMLGLYNANNARNSRVFADKLRDGLDIVNGQNPFQGKSQTEIAGLIDDCFSGIREEKIQFETAIGTGFGLLSGTGWDYALNSDGYTNIAGLFSVVPHSSPQNLGFDSIYALFFWYNIFKFDLIMPIGTALVMLYILLTTCLALVKRVFELTILFLLAPPMIAIAPLDGGNAEKRWRQEFMKRLLSVIAPVFAFNMYFLLVPLFSNIKIFDLSALSISAVSQVGAVGGTMTGFIGAVVTFYAIFDILFQVIAIIVGLEVVRDASALLSNLMGVDDLVKSGGELGKKYMEKGKNAVKAGVAVASLVTGTGAFKGAASMLKGRAAKMGNMFSKQGRAKNRLDKQIASEKKAGVYDEKNESEAVKSIRGEIADIEKSNADKAVKKANKPLTEKQQKRNLKKANKQIGRLADFGLKEHQAKEDYEQAVREHGAGSKQAVNAYARYSKFGAGNKEKSDELAQEAVKHSGFARGAKSVFSHMAHPFTVSSGATQELFGSFMKQANFNKTKEAFLKPFEGGDGGLRRLLDATSSLFGEPGNTFFKPLWNPNARHDLLFNSVPESKKQSTRVDQDMISEVRKDYDDKIRREIAEKSAEGYDKGMIAQMLAKREGDDFFNQFSALHNKQKAATEQGDAHMADLYAKQIKAKLDSAGITEGKIDEFYKGYQNDLAGKGDGKHLGQIQQFKDELRTKAEEQEKQRKQQAADAASGTGENSTKIEGDVKTKLTPDNISALAKKIGEEVAKAKAAGKPVDQSVLQPLLDSFTPIAESLTQLSAALEKLNEASDKK